MTCQSSPLPLDRASQADQELAVQAALDLAVTGIPIFPARLRWEEEVAQDIVSGWQAVSADRSACADGGVCTPRPCPGVPLGRPGLVVIDADHGILARRWRRWARRPYSGGGFHFIFRQPAGKPLGNREGEPPGADVDVERLPGWIVAPGAVTPDGAISRTADGAPSLIDAFRNGNIPTIPKWLVDFIRAPKPRKAPKEKPRRGRSTPDAAPSSGEPSRNMDRRGRAWAETVLTNGAAELAAMPP